MRTSAQTSFNIPISMKLKLQELQYRQFGLNMSDLSRTALWNFVFLNKQELDKYFKNQDQDENKEMTSNVGVRLPESIFAWIEKIKVQYNSTNREVYIKSLQHFFINYEKILSVKKMEVSSDSKI